MPAFHNRTETRSEGIKEERERPSPIAVGIVSLQCSVSLRVYIIDNWPVRYAIMQEILRAFYFRFYANKKRNVEAKQSIAHYSRYFAWKASAL